MQRLDTPPRNIVVCDLDGTLANDDHRVHHLRTDPTKRNWDAYFGACGEDKVYHTIAQLVRTLKMGGKLIYILSGRSDSVRADTIIWLQDHKIPYDHLQMRGKDDRTADDLLKVQWVESMGLSHRIWLVLEDRDRVVASWRNAGYTCLQVQPGAF